MSQTKRDLMTERWWKFVAYNQPAQYGWGTEEEADRYCDSENEGRAINMWQFYPANKDELPQFVEDDAFVLDEELRARSDQDDRQLIDVGREP